LAEKKTAAMMYMTDIIDFIFERCGGEIKWFRRIADERSEVKLNMALEGEKWPS
jgi:hypothetical protein